MKYKLFLVFMVCLLMIAGCTAGNELQWKTENMDNSTLLTSERESVTYRFDTARWDEEAAEAVVSDITEFLSVFGAPERGIIIYSGLKGDSAANVRIMGNKPTFAEYQALFSAAYGEPEDSVMAYSAVSLACKEKQLCEVENTYTDAELAKYFSNEDNLYLLDMTLPMIEDKFIDADSAEHARVAAISLAEYCLRERGAEEMRGLAFSAVDAPEKTQLKNEWLKAIGAEAEYEPLALLAYEKNDGENHGLYPYFIERESYRMFFGVKDVLAAGYKEIVMPYLELEPVIEPDFADAREVIGKIITVELLPTEKVDIRTRFDRGSHLADVAAWCNQEAGYIELFYDWATSAEAMVHEYVHYLTRNTLVMNTILGEGFTDEAAIFRCKNMLRHDSPLKKTSDAGATSSSDIAAILKEALGVPDMQTLYKLIATIEFMMQRREIESGTLTMEEIRSGGVRHISNFPYELRVNIVQYLYEQYGIEAFMENCGSMEEIEALCGMSFQELYETCEAIAVEQYGEAASKLIDAMQIYE